MEKMNNINDIALIFEGGGMRASFSAGIANVLVENELFFNYIAGISAGASILVSYMVRDTVRTKKCFVDIVDDPNFGSWKTFIKGKGFFNSEYIYENTSEPDQALPLNFENFLKNTAEFKIIAYDVLAKGKKVFTRDDVKCKKDLMKIVRASSSLPIIMPPTEFNNGVYYDGGLTGGIALDVAMKDGFKKFFIVRTQERGYRKKPVKHPRILRNRFRNNPQIAEALIKRPIIYNGVCDIIDQLEQAGLAYVVYPDEMKISNREKDRVVLEAMYRQGYDIGLRDLEKWKSFIVR